VTAVIPFVPVLKLRRLAVFFNPSRDAGADCARVCGFDRFRDAVVKHTGRALGVGLCCGELRACRSHRMPLQISSVLIKHSTPFTCTWSLSSCLLQWCRFHNFIVIGYYPGPVCLRQVKHDLIVVLHTKGCNDNDRLFRKCLASRAREGKTVSRVQTTR
jgi:hypothetical protein